MNIYKKSLIAFLIIAAIAGGYYYQTQNSSLLKGEIILNDQEQQQKDLVVEKADLEPTISIATPSADNSDVSVNVTIENLGPGKIEGTKPFSYSIYANDLEVFSNEDSYTTMEAGDSFSFSYPIPKSIYNYPDTGEIKVSLDTTNNIDEADEDNNSATVAY